MTTSLRHRRRAERFAQLLDEAGGGRRQHLRSPLDDELADLVALRHELVGCGPGPDVDPEFRTGLRAMLIAAAEREGIGRTAQPGPAHPTPRRTGPVRAAGPVAPTAHTPRPARGPRARTAVLAGVAVGAVAFTGMSAASENAVPGDALYGVKRSAERAQLALTSSDVGRGQLYLDFARTRLAEARSLAGDLDRVLDDMDRDTSQGVRLLTVAATNRQDRTALDAVDSFTAGQRVALAELAGRVTGADLARLTSSLELLDTIEERTAELRRSLRECAGPSATNLDSLGPVPDDCAALPVPGVPGPDRDRGSRPAAPTGQPGADQPADSGAAAPPAPAQPPAPSTTAGPTDRADQPAPATEPEDASQLAGPEENGGLLTGLNRLLGNLLGG